MTTKIARHPDALTLMSFAAGTLSEPLAAVVAAHVAMCPECRAEVRALNLVGEALLAMPGNDRGAGPVRVPGRPDEAEIRIVEAVPRRPDLLPEPIARGYGLSYDRIPWRRLGPGVWHHRLALSDDQDGDLRLLKIAAGRHMPEHGHGGTELTLVLDGAYSDLHGAYRRGDIQDIDEDLEHSPMADREFGCVCLIASERPARFKGLLGRLVHPLTGL